MPVTSDTRNRVVAAPARIQGYNILDSEWKDFAELVCNYLHKKTRWTGLYFLRAVSGLWAHQDGDGDHMTIYNWQGQRLAMNIGKRPLLRWQQAKTPVRWNLAIAARLAKPLCSIQKAKSSPWHIQA